MRLLYAEDEKSLARAVSTILTRNNYSVDVVYDGQSALDYLETGNYDGAVLDVMMPKLDGIEVLRRMRERGDSTPVLMLTAKSEIDDRVDCASYDLSGPKGSRKLAGKEFQMMEMLMRSPGKLISTETFMDRVWGYDSEAELNIVWVYISMLRKELRAVGADVEIKTQRGVGYFLEICP